MGRRCPSVDGYNDPDIANDFSDFAPETSAKADDEDVIAIRVHDAVRLLMRAIGNYAIADCLGQSRLIFWMNTLKIRLDRQSL